MRIIFRTNAIGMCNKNQRTKKKNPSNKKVIDCTGKCSYINCCRTVCDGKVVHLGLDRILWI